MAIPLLDYPLTSQNARVSNLAGDLHDNGLATISYGGAGHESYNAEVDGLIEKAYRQIFFHAMRSDRDVFLESQLRSGNITVRDFIRGLLLSKRFGMTTTNAAPITEWSTRLLVALAARSMAMLSGGLGRCDCEKGFNAFVDTAR